MDDLVVDLFQTQSGCFDKARGQWLEHHVYIEEYVGEADYTANSSETAIFEEVCANCFKSRGFIEFLEEKERALERNAERAKKGL